MYPLQIKGDYWNDKMRGRLFLKENLRQKLNKANSEVKEGDSGIECGSRSKWKGDRGRYKGYEKGTVTVASQRVILSEKSDVHT